MIAIGPIIENTLRNQERTVAWFARQLCCTRPNVYRLFRKETVDVLLLYRISRILNFDFFVLYSEELKKGQTIDSQK